MSGTKYSGSNFQRWVGFYLDGSIYARKNLVREKQIESVFGIFSQPCNNSMDLTTAVAP